VTGGFAAVETTYGTSSTVTTISLSGSNLIGDVTATAPAGFEVSSNGVDFGPTASFLQAGGVANGTLYVRLAATSGAGTWSGSVSLESADAAPVAIAIPSSSVAKKTLIVTAVAATRLVGEANPTFTATITGFVNGETQSVVSGSPLFTTTATAASPAGTFAITVAVGTLAAANYDFTFVSGSLTITSVLILDVAADQTVTRSLEGFTGITFVKRGAGRVVLTGASSHTGGVVVEEGELVVRDAAALGSGVLDVKDGARITLDVHDGTVSVAELALAAGGLIDFGYGKLTIAAGGYTPSTIFGLLQAGYSAAWSDTSGFVSRHAASMFGGGLGSIVNEDGSITLGFAVSGDTNLDGLVDVLDISSMLGSGLYDTLNPSTWAEGDFNYDGMVDILDLSELLGSGQYDTGWFIPAPAVESQAKGQSLASASPVSAVDAAFLALANAADDAASTPAKRRRFPSF